MRWIIKDSVYCERIGEELVLLDMAGCRYFGLDPVGTRLFELLREHAEPEKVVDEALTEFEVSREQLSADLNALLVRLSENGLIQGEP